MGVSLVMTFDQGGACEEGVGVLGGGYIKNVGILIFIYLYLWAVTMIQKLANGLSLQHHAILWTNVDFLSIEPLKTHFDSKYVSVKNMPLKNCLQKVGSFVKLSKC